MPCWAYAPWRRHLLLVRPRQDGEVRGRCQRKLIDGEGGVAAAPPVANTQKKFAATPNGVDLFPPTGLRPAPLGAIERPFGIGRSGIKRTA